MPGIARLINREEKTAYHLMSLIKEKRRNQADYDLLCVI